MTAQTAPSNAPKQTALAPVDFALFGVGGQGIVLGSDLLAEAGLIAGYDVKKTDALGMAQRGGSVVSYVRWAERVHSPLPTPGSIDVIIAMEKLEAARAVDWLRPGGLAIVNDHEMRPPSVGAGVQRYPEDAEVEAILRARTERVFWLNAHQLALEAGNAKAANVVLLGFASAFLPMAMENWSQAVEHLLPARIRPVNLAALARGREEALRRLSDGGSR